MPKRFWGCGRVFSQGFLLAPVPAQLSLVLLCIPFFCLRSEPVPFESLLWWLQDEQRRYRSKLAAAQDVMHQTTSTTTGPPGWVAPKSTLLPTKPPGKSCGKKKKKKENKCEFVPEFDPSISLVTPSNPTQIDQQLADKLDQTCTLDPSKRLRNLLKKFKEIEMLEATTSLDQLTDAQREKLSRKADLERQIKQLESPKSTES